jgi:large subunit ribosomal protein L35
MAKKIKLKSNSSVKKRFKLSCKGFVLATQSCKRHGMRKRSARVIRNNRGRVKLCSSAMKVVKKLMV